MGIEDIKRAQQVALAPTAQAQQQAAAGPAQANPVVPPQANAVPGQAPGQPAGAGITPEQRQRYAQLAAEAQAMIDQANALLGVQAAPGATPGAPAPQGQPQAVPPASGQPGPQAGPKPAVPPTSKPDAAPKAQEPPQPAGSAPKDPSAAPLPTVAQKTAAPKPPITPQPGTPTAPDAAVGPKPSPFTKKAPVVGAPAAKSPIPPKAGPTPAPDAGKPPVPRAAGPGLAPLGPPVTAPKASTVPKQGRDALEMVIQGMGASEKHDFDNAYLQAKPGFTGSEHDFLLDQYHRHKTEDPANSTATAWLSGSTMAALDHIMTSQGPTGGVTAGGSGEPMPDGQRPAPADPGTGMPADPAAEAQAHLAEVQKTKDEAEASGELKDNPDAAQALDEALAEAQKAVDVAGGGADDTSSTKAPDEEIPHPEDMLAQVTEAHRNALAVGAADPNASNRTPEGKLHAQLTKATAHAANALKETGPKAAPVQLSADAMLREKAFAALDLAAKWTKDKHPRGEAGLFAKERSVPQGTWGEQNGGKKAKVSPAVKKAHKAVTSAVAAANEAMGVTKPAPDATAVAKPGASAALTPEGLADAQKRLFGDDQTQQSQQAAYQREVAGGFKGTLADYMYGLAGPDAVTGDKKAALDSILASEKAARYAVPRQDGTPAHVITDKVALQGVIDTMAPEQRQALEQGLAQAQADRWFPGDLTDFLADTYVKHQTEPEDQSTAEAALSGDTYAALEALPTGPPPSSEGDTGGPPPSSKGDTGGPPPSSKGDTGGPPPSSQGDTGGPPPSSQGDTGGPITPPPSSQGDTGGPRQAVTTTDSTGKPSPVMTVGADGVSRPVTTSAPPAPPSSQGPPPSSEGDTGGPPPTGGTPPPRSGARTAPVPPQLIQGSERASTWSFADWDEGDHPREHGKFAAKTGLLGNIKAAVARHREAAAEAHEGKIKADIDREFLARKAAEADLGANGAREIRAKAAEEKLGRKMTPDERKALDAEADAGLKKEAEDVVRTADALLRQPHVAPIPSKALWLSGEWEEDLHPRAGGKFAAKAGGAAKAGTPETEKAMRAQLDKAKGVFARARALLGKVGSEVANQVTGTTKEQRASEWKDAQQWAAGKTGQKNLAADPTKGDPAVLTALNAILKSELTAVLQYMLHSEMQDNWGYEVMAKETRGRAMEEMQHAESIIERIIFLQAIPAMVADSVTPGADVSEQIAGDTELERAAISLYREAVLAARAKADAGTALIMEANLQAEESHVNVLDSHTSAIKDVGYQAWLAEQLLSMSAEFDETKHPREHGKFSEKEGGPSEEPKSDAKPAAAVEQHVAKSQGFLARAKSLLEKGVDKLVGTDEEWKAKEAAKAAKEAAHPSRGVVIPKNGFAQFGLNDDPETEDALGRTWVADPTQR